MDLIGLITKLLKCSLILTGYGLAFILFALMLGLLIALVRDMWRDKWW